MMHTWLPQMFAKREEEYFTLRGGPEVYGNAAYSSKAPALRPKLTPPLFYLCQEGVREYEVRFGHLNHGFF